MFENLNLTINILYNSLIIKAHNIIKYFFNLLKID